MNDELANAYISFIEAVEWEGLAYAVTDYSDWENLIGVDDVLKHKIDQFRYWHRLIENDLEPIAEALREAGHYVHTE